jgi:hypothetical protein
MRCAAFVKQPRFLTFLRLPPIRHPRDTHTNEMSDRSLSDDRPEPNAVARIGHVARVVRCRSTIGVFSSSVGNFVR